MQHSVADITCCKCNNLQIGTSFGRVETDGADRCDDDDHAQRDRNEQHDDVSSSVEQDLFLLVTVLRPVITRLCRNRIVGSGRSLLAMVLDPFSYDLGNLTRYEIANLLMLKCKNICINNFRKPTYPVQNYISIHQCTR